MQIFYQYNENRVNLEVGHHALDNRHTCRYTSSKSFHANCGRKQTTGALRRRRRTRTFIVPTAAFTANLIMRYFEIQINYDTVIKNHMRGYSTDCSLYNCLSTAEV